MGNGYFPSRIDDGYSTSLLRITTGAPIHASEQQSWPGADPSNCTNQWIRLNRRGALFIRACGRYPSRIRRPQLRWSKPGTLIPQRRTILRPDWEHVTTKVLDYLFDTFAPKNDRLELDLNRFAIIGASMGGYFALRASVDGRIKACVSCDGFYSLFEVARSRMPSWFVDSWLDGSMSDGVFNAISNFLARFNFQLDWEFKHSQWCYGVKTPADVMRVMQSMSLKMPDGSEYLDKVHCPVMVTGAAQTIYFEPQISAEMVFAYLRHLEKSKKLL